MLLRQRLFAVPVVCLAATGLVGCGGGDDEEPTPGADALCSDFTWDDDKGLQANEKRMGEIVEGATGDTADLGTAVRGAEADCSDVVAPYFAAVEQDQKTDNEVVPPTAEELEDPQLTEQLDARGIDKTEVLLLGSVMEATGVEKVGEDEQLSYGVAQRRTVEAIEQCEAVAAGEKTYDDVTQFYVEQGAKEGQAKQVSTYLESVFCELV